MAKYQSTKVLKKAVPTINIADGVVKSWEIEVIFSYNGWSRVYPHTEEVIHLNKRPEDFRKSELIAMMPAVMDDVFDSHYETFNTPPSEEKQGNFDVRTLAD